MTQAHTPRPCCVLLVSPLLSLLRTILPSHITTIDPRTSNDFLPSPLFLYDTILLQPHTPSFFLCLPHPLPLPPPHAVL
ncbi:hypothetical protein B0H14DRAFT_2881260 [Mycena olivaceomarginata]|nr:hypothetical protein B0H14DRAFT_2881260 [Mycena olivaceomarginata]